MPDDPQHDPIQEPPRKWSGILRSLGPGLIIAGSIVGSGELIATTKVGAETGFYLLWIIIIGCIIKVFTQVEFGRHTITHSETPLVALNSVPGPRTRRVNWIIWFWGIMTILVITQQGGIVGAIGQTLTMSVPITAEGKAHHEERSARLAAQVDAAVERLRSERSSEANPENAPAPAPDPPPGDSGARDPPAKTATPHDPVIWATLMALITSVLLWFGRYSVIQAVSTIFVAAFTLVTIVTVAWLQFTDWAVQPSEIASGLSFQLPPAAEGSGLQSLGTALAAFGIIGVGAAELIMYPYWCLEKGYARHAGQRDGSETWLQRAKGWVRILQVDAWLSMVVYTFATIAFFMLGAAVLGRTGLNPEKGDLVATLSQMYVPVFGEWAPTVFLFGAFAVLYSTFFVAAAGNARMVADGLGIFGFHDGSEKTRARWTRVVAAAWPLLALATFLFFRAPAAMVLASGIAQAAMLPVLGIAALYFRYQRSDKDLRPGRLWDLLLWLSCFGFLLAGAYALWTQVSKIFG